LHLSLSPLLTIEVRDQRQRIPHTLYRPPEQRFARQSFSVQCIM
jgi:hypothetical protein